MLELISIKKEYVTKAGNTVALDNINLRFAEKGLVFIAGKSGSGKTTLLNIIGGLDGFDSGEIKLNGKSFDKFTPKDFDSYRNTFVGVIFQEYNLLSEYTVEKNVEIALELQGRKNQDGKISRLFDDIDISGLENRKPSQLSGGQKQRIAIARALVKNPKIILADELTGALDSATGIQVMDILKKLSKEKLVIVVSHDSELAEKYADRIIRISDGKVVEDITLTEVELKDNVHLSDECLTVKLASKLTDEQTKILVSAISDSKKIVFTDKICVKDRKKTIQPKPSKEQDVHFISSKMKLKSVASLGLKSLMTKPIRLIVTILLSVVAFAVFGLFDSVASFDDAKVITSILRDRTYSALPVYATYTDDYYDNVGFKFSQEQIEQINDDTGYAFRGVYDIDDSDVIIKSTKKRKGLNSSVQIIRNVGSEPIGYQYYIKEINGIVTFDKNEIVERVIDPKGFNYEIVMGEYPVFSGEESLSLQIGISSYMADSILFWSNVNGGLFSGKAVQSYEDLIGIEITVDDNCYMITAIIDCGDIPEKFDKLKSKHDKTLKADFDTFVNSGCYLNLFAPTGLVDSLRLNNNRTVNYYSDYVNVTQEVCLDGLSYSYTGKYYNISDVSENNYLFFDASRTAESLNENECLISINDLGVEYLANEFESSVDVFLIDRIHSEINNFKSSTNVEVRSESFMRLLEYIEQIREQIGLDGSVVKQLTINSRSKNNTDLAYDNNLNVVGVYFGVDTDLLHNNYFNPIMVSEEGLNYLHVCTNQGIYSRVITPLAVNRSGERIIGDKINQDSGIKLNWFENSVLETVADQREMIDQALNLVLYLAIILALFSVFMLYNYISLSITSKRQTIGILRTLGADNRNIFFMFFIESIIISLITVVFACVVAYLGCIFINNYLIKIMNLTLKIALFDYRQILLITIASIITGVLSSLLPILKISKKKPVELIRM